MTKLGQCGRIAGGICSILLAVFKIIWAQESDTAVFKDQQQSFTVLSEIQDAKERQAFLAAFQATGGGERHALAQAFADTYPQSWLLAQVYDLAARSSIDSGQYDRALQEAAFSLRIVPENPTLLVLIANVQAQRKLFEEAERSARDALLYLDQFARLGNLSEDQWRIIKPQLKASAYFALGRTLATKGMRQSASGATLTQALDALNRSAAWNSEDRETFYLRALVELRLGQKDTAGSDLAYVARGSTAMAAEARARFRQVSDQDISKLPGPTIELKLREDAIAPTSRQVLSAGYAGSAACQGCHVHEYGTWRQTGMARMLREYKPENMIGDFSPGSNFKAENGSSAIRMGMDARHYFEVRGEDGRWRRFNVDYTIGSKWQQAYATRLADGRLQVLPIEYNIQEKAWINYWKIIDPPESKRAILSDFSKLTPATNYQENCAICHTSQLKASSNTENGIESAVFRQPGINCEMCHGPSAWHAAQKQKGRAASKGIPDPPIDFRQIDNRTGVRVCAQCHKQSALRQMGDDREMNYSAKGASFVPASWSRPYDAFSHRAFYKDGRFRETTFVVEAFTRSACYRKGTAQCATCHSPHLTDFSQNLTSLKFKGSPDEMCLGCHEDYRGRGAQHTHHPAGSEASQCVSCHMPRIMNALLFQARSHQIEIPRADLTERFGQSESPNACLICHSDKDARWAGERLLRWNNGSRYN